MKTMNNEPDPETVFPFEVDIQVPKCNVILSHTNPNGAQFSIMFPMHATLAVRDDVGLCPLITETTALGSDG